MTRLSIAKLFNLFGYFALYAQLMWACALVIPQLIASGALGVSTVQQPEPAVSALPTVSLPEPLTLIMSAAVVIIFIAVVFYATKESARLTHSIGEASTLKITEIALPVITHHKKLSKKKRLELSAQLQLLIKLVLCITAFLLSLATIFFKPPLPFNVIATVSLVMMPWGILWFCLAYLLVRVPVKTRHTK